ncbi:hypothetical protein CTAYLR_008594 [Chrysophaeum taylorii]|uniref:GST N-terminal domain-containing protein n=1 Tax=Chrysophaeum taylorii TaxID=2483200 RepID=A0AAD7UIE7_9STRA|nr:hypothetical protein CTAYLR_008594 [Chrysophaeum taylorii]
MILALVVDAALGLSATVAPSAYTKPAQVVFHPLPTVYAYDHCPFCVRVRLAFGLKNIKHDVRFMANDDVELPSSKVGKKIAPIFEMAGTAPFAESLDIVNFIDSDPRFGPTGAFKPMSGRTDLKAWQKSVQEPLRKLQRPRYVKTVLPEFMFGDARDAFVKNHQLPPYEKAEWKDDTKFTMTTRWALYDSMMAQTPQLVAEVNQKLKELEPLIHCETCCTEGGLSLDDVDLWARLRSLTLVKGIDFPPTVRAYLDYFSKAGDVPLYDAIAL